MIIDSIKHFRFPAGNHCKEWHAVDGCTGDISISSYAFEFYGGSIDNFDNLDDKNKAKALVEFVKDEISVFDGDYVFILDIAPYRDKLGNADAFYLAIVAFDKHYLCDNLEYDGNGTFYFNGD